jgi:hypothetical protein
MQALGESGDGKFAGGVGNQIGNRNFAADRPNVDDRALPTGNEMW